MAEFLDYASETVPDIGDVIVMLDGNDGVTKYMTREDFFSNPPFADGAITADMLAPKVVQTVTSAGTISPTVGARLIKVTALATNTTVANPTETFTDEKQLVFRFKDNGTARTIGWGSMYRAIGLTLPTATVANKTMYVSGIVNLEDNKIDILSVARET